MKDFPIKIAVTGADGQLGKTLNLLSKASPDKAWVFAGRDALAIEDEGSVHAWIKAHRPQYCINCAAYTAVDKAEAEPEKAFLTNASAVGHLASACAAFQTRLIHLSTDYVFDGTLATPWKENDTTNPLNVYGASKRKGEELAFARQQETVVIRTSWLYSAYGNNFVKTMMRLMRERPSLNVVNDQIGAPTWATDLAAAILKIIDHKTFHPGIYHYSDEGKISWYDFAMAIKAITGATCAVLPVSSSAYPTAAIRPTYSLLDVSKIKETYGVNVPGWEASLKACIAELQANG